MRRNIKTNLKKNWKRFKEANGLEVNAEFDVYTDNKYNNDEICITFDKKVVWNGHELDHTGSYYGTITDNEVTKEIIIKFLIELRKGENKAGKYFHPIYEVCDNKNAEIWEISGVFPKYENRIKTDNQEALENKKEKATEEKKFLADKKVKNEMYQKLLETMEDYKEYDNETKELYKQIKSKIYVNGAFDNHYQKNYESALENVSLK